MTHFVTLSALLLVTSVAVVTDLRFNRIPNAVCLVGILGGVALHGMELGFVTGTLMAIASGLLAGLILMPFYLMGGMAAGDIKLMAAVGAIVGWGHAIPAVLFTLIFGSILALVYIILRGRGVEFCKRYFDALKLIVRYRTFYLVPANEGSIARSRFPYALAIACGGMAALFLPDLMVR